jgi:hypothetical protein
LHLIFKKLLDYLISLDIIVRISLLLLEERRRIVFLLDRSLIFARIIVNLLFWFFVIRWPIIILSCDWSLNFWLVDNWLWIVDWLLLYRLRLWLWLRLRLVLIFLPVV